MPTAKKTQSAIQVTVVFMLALSFFLCLAMVAPRPILSGNEGSHISLLYSIIRNNSFELTFGPADTSYYHGKYYSNKPPGYVFALIAPYKIYYRLFNKKLSAPEMKQNMLIFMKVASALFSAFSAVVLLLLLNSFNLSLTGRYIGITAALGGTLYPAYATLANSIPFSVLLCLISILSYRLYAQKKKPGYYLITTICMSYAFIVDYSNCFFLIPLCVPLLKRIKENKALLLYSFPALLPLVILLIYNYFVFDNCWVLSYTHYKPPSYVNWEGASQAMSIANIPSGLFGLLVSPARGMFIISPITCLGLIGGFSAKKLEIKEINKDVLLLLLMTFTGIVFISSYSLWHGGHSIGYRHILIPAIILGLFSSFAYEQAQKYLKWGVAITLAWSCTTGILAFFIQLNTDLLQLTWAGEPKSIHAGFYSELLMPFLFN